MDPDLKLIPKKELIPSLQTLAAINIFEKNIDTDKLLDNLIKFVEDTNEEFDEAVYQIKRYDEVVYQIKRYKSLYNILCFLFFSLFSLFLCFLFFKSSFILCPIL